VSEARALPHPAQLLALSLHDLPAGRGKAPAVLVWLVLWSHARWGSMIRDVWPSNATLARESGLELRAVELGISVLRKAGKISSRIGKRKGCGYGRILELHPLGDGVNPKVVIPDPATMAHLRRVIRRSTSRPTALVATFVAAFAWCSLDRGIEGVRRIPLGLLRKILGAAGGSFADRLLALEGLGLLTRAGKQWRHGMTIAALGQLLRLEVELDRKARARLPAPGRLASVVIRELPRLAGAG
jgi:hypothetical protein